MGTHCSWKRAALHTWTPAELLLLFFCCNSTLEPTNAIFWGQMYAHWRLIYLIANTTYARATKCSWPQDDLTDRSHSSKLKNQEREKMAFAIFTFSLQILSFDHSPLFLCVFAKMRSEAITIFVFSRFCVQLHTIKIHISHSSGCHDMFVWRLAPQNKLVRLINLKPYRGQFMGPPFRLAQNCNVGIKWNHWRSFDVFRSAPPHRWACWHCYTAWHGRSPLLRMQNHRWAWKEPVYSSFWLLKMVKGVMKKVQQLFWALVALTG